MSRRSLVLTTVGFSFVIVGITVLLYCLARYEPKWYLNAEVPAGPTRAQCSQEFITEFFTLISATADPVWWGKFRQEQVNSYFEEQFFESNLDRRMLPETISEPRLWIEPEKLHLGFRYGSGVWSTVITADLSVWLPVGEQNVMALELVGLHAGVVPIKSLSILERIAQSARDNNIEVTWYRHNGHPVALIRFQADQQRATVLLQAITLDKGSIEIRGCNLEASPARASVPPAEPNLAESGG